jgi:putative addiction module component (TIGR02574 family)
MSNLQDEIGQLSAEEKFELLEALWASLEASGPALTDEQRAELDDRVTRYEEDPANVVSWEKLNASLIK